MKLAFLARQFPFTLTSRGSACSQTLRAGVRAQMSNLQSSRSTVENVPRQAASTATLSETSHPRVLSIQSHVVHGYVGNKCAVFPLQLLGFDVDPLHSVQLSNHAGYPVFKGHVFDGAHLSLVMDGLEANGLTTYSHLLTGYIGSVSLVNAIADVIRRLKLANPHLTYVCDPVMGDEGKMYVSSEVAVAVKQVVVPLASMVVPNTMEAEVLTGRSIRTLADAVAACADLHAVGPHTVVITSFTSPDDPDHISIIASTTRPQTQQQQEQQQQSSAPSGTSTAAASNADVSTAGDEEAASSRSGKATVMRLRVRRIPAHFSGTGDLMAALLLAWTHKYPADLATALEKTIAGLQAVLAGTAAACSPDELAATGATAQVLRARELRLIQHAQALLDPPVVDKVEQIS